MHWNGLEALGGIWLNENWVCGLKEKKMWERRGGFNTYRVGGEQSFPMLDWRLANAGRTDHTDLESHVGSTEYCIVNDVFFGRRVTSQHLSTTPNFSSSFGPGM